jgi:penicillin-binding protein 1A
MRDQDPRKYGGGTRGGVPPRRRSNTGRGRGDVAGRERIWRGLRWAAMGVLGAGALGLLALSLLFLYYGSDPNLPNLKKVSDYHPPQASRILDRNGQLVGTVGGPERRRVVPFEIIPKHFREAVLAAEDPSFYQHEGLDYWGILRALVSNVMAGRIGPGRWGQGGSTLTQQVVKLLVLSPEKTPRRKIQEMILARRLSKQLSKDEILTIYLNYINYGEGHYGCEEAAQFFFGKSIKDVDIGEAAFLAGVPQIPSKLSPYKHPEAAKTRQRYVLRQMVEHGYLDQPTAEKYAERPITVVPRSAAETVEAGEAVGAVYRLLAEKFGGPAIATLGAEVKTTLDLSLQKLARESLERGLEAVDQRQGYRGPVGHYDGAKLAAYRTELKLARMAGKGGETARAGAALAAQLKVQPKFGLHPLRESEIFEGVVDKIEKDPKDADGKGGRFIIDMGGEAGVVDLALEDRYSKEKKPLADRFKPGDLVRVRFAPERRHGPALPGAPVPLALELGPQAAMVVMDPRTREVLALVGGYDFHAGGYDRTLRAQRQAGSAFKPFVYAAAIESGRFTAASVVNDAPEVYALWKPQNYEKESFKGPVTLRTALADSINTVAIRLLNDVGQAPVIDLATKAGIVTPLPPDVGLSLALGANSVTPLELANAYATFAAGGERQNFRLIEGINGEDFAKAGAKTEAPSGVEPIRAMKPETAYIITSLMRSVVTVGTGHAAGARLKRPLAGKTGTSSGYKDAWFIGYAPDLLAAVWVGFDDGRSLGQGEAGGKTAVPIWTEFMAKALADRPSRDFVTPPGIQITRIDPKTGLLPAPGDEGVEEVFLDGTAPKEVAGSSDEAAAADKLLMQGSGQ